jgi:hypothetical protein
MKEQEVIILDEADLIPETEVKIEEKSLVVLDYTPKKEVDETISSPDQYVSRYHYDTKNLDAEIELCPHCKKPTFSAFRKVVADSAMNYLIEKEDQRHRRHNRRRIITFILGGLCFLGGLYYWLFYILSGARI